MFNTYYYLGFGDGFKTAAATLLYDRESFKKLEWEFTAPGHSIKWDFVGLEQEGASPVSVIVYVSFFFPSPPLSSLNPNMLYFS